MILQWILGLLVILGSIGLIIGLLSPIFYLRDKTASNAITNRPISPTTAPTRPITTSTRLTSIGSSSKRLKSEKIKIIDNFQIRF